MALSSPQQRRLGEELRRLRKAAGLTMGQVAEHLGISEPHISRVERAQRSCSSADLAAMLKLFSADEETTSALLALGQQQREQGKARWWAPYASVISSSYAEYLALESAASAITDFQPMVPPGLLQTEKYAYAITQATGAGDDDRVESLVEVRMERQRRLAEANPLRLHALITEAALCIQVGGAHVMTAQLEHLVEMARRPNITLNIVPFATGVCGALASGFTLFDFPHPKDPSVVLQEVSTGDNVSSENERELRQIRRLVKRIERAALSPEDSVKLITRVLQRMGRDQ